MLGLVYRIGAEWHSRGLQLEGLVACASDEKQVDDEDGDEKRGLR